MPAGKHVGKRSNVTFPPDLYEKIADLAKNEQRTISKQIVYLCTLGLQQYEKQKPQGTLEVSLKKSDD